MHAPKSETEQPYAVERVKTSIGKSGLPSSAYRVPEPAQMISTNAILLVGERVSHREERVLIQQTMRPVRGSISDYVTDDILLNGVTIGLLLGYSNYRRCGVYWRLGAIWNFPSTKFTRAMLRGVRLRTPFQESCVYMPGESWAFLNYSTSWNYAFSRAYTARAVNYQSRLATWGKGYPTCIRRMVLFLREFAHCSSGNRLR